VASADGVVADELDEDPEAPGAVPWSAQPEPSPSGAARPVLPSGAVGACWVVLPSVEVLGESWTVVVEVEDPLLPSWAEARAAPPKAMPTTRAPPAT
jgi:hypothetical protein